MAFFSLLSNADAFFFFVKAGVFIGNAVLQCGQTRVGEPTTVEQTWHRFRPLPNDDFVPAEEEDGIIPVFATSSSVAVSQFISVVSVPL